MRRIICLGNRLAAEDAAGFRVFLALSGRALPAGVEAIDGGLGGLDLIRFVEGAERVVFVDGVSGFGRPGETVTLGAERLAALTDGSYGHGAGLPYLLGALPAACDGELPPMVLVGVEGECGDAGIEEAARVALALAAEGGGAAPGGGGA